MKFAHTIGCVIALAASAAGTRQGARVTALYADALLDVRHGRTIRDALVVVTGDRITHAGAKADLQARVPTGAEHVELGSVTLLPGLIDGHVHLALAGVPAENARATVEAGFTTVQDLGANDAQILRLR